MTRQDIRARASAATPPESAIQANYMSGFGNGFETEALPGALPLGRNSPQKCAYGLYAEQLSGSPFTAPRTTNERSWLYRIRPTVAHWGDFRKVDAGLWRTAPAVEAEPPIGPMRWDPLPVPAEPLSFREGVRTITTAGDGGAQAGAHPARPQNRPRPSRSSVRRRSLLVGLPLPVSRSGAMASGTVSPRGAGGGDMSS